MTGPHAFNDDTRGFPRGRELAAIVLFWSLFAVLSVTNWLFPPGGQGPPFSSRGVGIGIFDALLWALATPPLFWMASRYGDERMSRTRRIILFALVGVAVALSIDLVIEWMRTNLLPPPPPRDGFRPRERSLWTFARGRFLNEYMLYIAVLSAGVARDYFRRYQRRLEESAALRAQLAEARFMVLQNQLNPHFLFNTLNAVAALVERDPPGVRRMIARLSDLLRATLEPTAEPEVPLSRELTLTARYLEILEIRFQGRLQTSIDAPSDLHSALVPQLVLQPLIENAMKYAVSRTSAAARIDVAARRDGYDLVLTVADTGPGTGQSANTTGEIAIGTGIGLSNTRARLAQLYDDEYELTLAPNAQGGTTVTIRLPYHTASGVDPAPAAAR
jgi:signal transduction histidine kinase